MRRSECRLRLKSKEFCAICSWEERINTDSIQSNENEKMNENDVYPNLLQNEDEIKHDQIECLDRKINYAFDVLFGLVQQLAEGKKHDLQAASIRHQTGMLKMSQMYAKLNNNLHEQERDNEENRILDMHIHGDSEVRVVSRLNLAEIYDERSATLLSSHKFVRTAVNSLVV